MQTVVFTGRLAADPFISADGSRASFRLLENRGETASGEKVVNGVNCVAFGQSFVDRVIRPGLAAGCEAVVVGRFQDRSYTGRDDVRRMTKELLVERIDVLDWAGEPAEAA